MATQKVNGMAFEWAIAADIAKQSGGSIIEDAYSIGPKNAFEAGISDTRRKSFIRAAEVAVKHILEKEQISYSENSLQNSLVPSQLCRTERQGRQGLLLLLSTP